jgi:hypothetical protein
MRNIEHCTLVDRLRSYDTSTNDHCGLDVVY